MNDAIADIAKVLATYEKIPPQFTTAYHHPRYVQMDAADKKNSEAVFFIYEEDNAIYYHPLHLTATSQYDVIDLESVRGYGGPITTSMSTEFLRRARSSYLQWVTSLNVCVEFVRFSPLIKNHEYYYGDSWFDRQVRYIDLQGYSIERQSNRAKGCIKKSLREDYIFYIDSNPEKNVIFEFADLYHQRMNELSAAAQYYFSNEYLLELFSGRSFLVYLRLNSRMECAVVVLDHPHCIEYHLSAASAEARAAGATNLMLHKIATHFCNNKKYFHLGGGTNSNVDNSLLKFKSGAGHLSGEFYIGKTIHKPEQYDQLKNTLGESFNQRVIFYRD